ncbi:MAG: DedA family protein [Candidatus Thermoplasmatota archaeon]|nr:DedA family protein [Candidatus Thermoplasmatota archaeon]
MFHLAIATSLANFVITLIQTLGYPGIFFLMLLEGLLLPIPSEVVMAFGGYLAFSSGLPDIMGVPAFIILLIVGSLGNVAGAYLAYMLGDYGGIPLIMKYGKYVMLDEGSIRKTHEWFLRYGPVSVFLTRLVPIFRTFISIPAGIAKMNRTSFLLLTLAGSLIWDSLLIYLGYVLGPHWNTILSFFDEYQYVAIGILIAIILWWFIGKLIKKSRTPDTE